MSYIQIKKFVSQNRFEIITITLIVSLSLLLRLYRIGEYLTFLGDEGRDVRIVRDILRGNLAFIGPQTSIGNMYLGPLYYYVMAPALLLSGLNPVGPAILVAFFGTLTVALTWWVARTWFDSLSGILAALLMALSPVAIIYSRSSWNPNPMPFFALIFVWSIYQVWQRKQFKYLILISVSLAFSLQMHYLGLLLIPLLVIFWSLSLRDIQAHPAQKKLFLTNSLKSFIIFLFLMSPLVLFDLKHQGMNFKAFQAFLTTSQTANVMSLPDLRHLGFVWDKVTTDLLLGQVKANTVLMPASIFLLGLWAFAKTSKKSEATILLTWIGLSVLGLGIYRQDIYAHYLGFFWPAIYILTAWIISQLFQDTYIHKLLGFILLSWLIVIGIQRSPLKQTPNSQLQRTEQVVDLIIKESKGEPFNFGLIAERNYDESYRYFLENKKASMVRGEDGITEQLFVVCEDTNCQPEGHPQWQIAIFGPASTVDQWQIDHVKIFKLIHAK